MVLEASLNLALYKKIWWNSSGRVVRSQDSSWQGVSHSFKAQKNSHELPDVYVHKVFFQSAKFKLPPKTNDKLQFSF